MVKFFEVSRAVTQVLEIGTGVAVGSSVLALVWAAVVPALIR